MVEEFQVLAADLGGLYVFGLNVSALSGIGCGRSGVYGSLLGISTWMVSVLPPRLSRVLCEDSFICRRSECVLFCFLSARTGEIFKDRVLRFGWVGASARVAEGLDGESAMKGERLNNALILGGLSGGVAGAVTPTA